MPSRTVLSQVRLGQNMLFICKFLLKSQKIIGQKEWIVRPGIEPGPPEDSTTIVDTLKKSRKFCNTNSA